MRTLGAGATGAVTGSERRVIRPLAAAECVAAGSSTDAGAARGADRAPADARSSSQAVVSSAGTGTPACPRQRERRSCPRNCPSRTSEESVSGREARHCVGSAVPRRGWPEGGSVLRAHVPAAGRAHRARWSQGPGLPGRGHSERERNERGPLRGPRRAPRPRFGLKPMRAAPPGFVLSPDPEDAGRRPRRQPLGPERPRSATGSQHVAGGHDSTSAGRGVVTAVRKPSPSCTV